MDEVFFKTMFTLGFMMLFQLVDHIYNSLVDDLNLVTNASIAMGIVEFLFSIATLHENNLTIFYGNLSQELGY
jgi:hypothetical protein